MLNTSSTPMNFTILKQHNRWNVLNVTIHCYVRIMVDINFNNANVLSELVFNFL